MPDTVTQTDLSTLIARIIKDNKRASREKHLVLFSSLVRSEGYEEYLTAIVRNSFNMLYKRAAGSISPPTTAELTERAAARTARRQAEDRRVADLKADIVRNLMELALPNGKKLRECTGRECIEAGSFFRRVGQSLGPDDVVGEVLSENDLQEILTKHQATRPEARPDA